MADLSVNAQQKPILPSNTFQKAASKSKVGFTSSPSKASKASNKNSNSWQNSTKIEIDANGILQVSAEDKGTGNKEKITITNDQNRLTPEDIERMIQESEQFAEEDKKMKEKVESRNELESYAYSLKNQVNDKEKLGAKISDEDKEKIEEAVNEKIAWLEENQEADGEEFKAQKKELEEIVQPIIAKLYQQGGGPPPGGEEPDDDVDKDEL